MVGTPSTMATSRFAMMAPKTISGIVRREGFTHVLNIFRPVNIAAQRISSSKSSLVADELHVRRVHCDLLSLSLTIQKSKQLGEDAMAATVRSEVMVLDVALEFFDGPGI
mmetsp:Transcript_29/g.103  ORF Transcript_29/g.103 Transcript_29/m.103 type:complete len:110 (-) Transcript_29:132-461(-)